MIDLFIKYGAAIAAAAYGLGLLEQSDLLRWLGVEGDFSFADPRYFAVGAFLLIPLVLVLVIVAAPSLAHRPLSVWLPVWCFVITFVMFLIPAIFKYHAWIRDVLWVGTAGGLASGITAFGVSRMGMHSPPGLREQFYLLTAITCCLLVFETGAAKVHWRRLLAEQGQHQIRLLVAGEAVRGAQEMGLTFPALRPGEKPASEKLAELSGPVDIVFESEHAYVLRLNGQVMRLSKAKVLGSIP